MSSLIESPNQESVELRKAIDSICTYMFPECHKDGFKGVYHTLEDGTELPPYLALCHSGIKQQGQGYGYKYEEMIPAISEYITQFVNYCLAVKKLGHTKIFWREHPRIGWEESHYGTVTIKNQYYVYSRFITC